MNLKINKETLKEIGKGGLKVAKFIGIEGTKVLVLRTAATAITTGFEEGFGAVKNLKLDDVVGKKKDKDGKPKLGLFSKKKKVAEEVIEEVVEVVEHAEPGDVIEVTATVVKGKDNEETK